MVGVTRGYFGNQAKFLVQYREDPSDAGGESEKNPFVDESENYPPIISKSEYDTTATAAASIMNGDTIVSSTRDSFVVLITVTIIFFTLLATYFLWKKHRSTFAAAHCKLEEYRYIRLSQNDAEVDNISFQGDLTQKALLTTVPMCTEDDGDDDVRPAMLRLENDSLTTISNGNTSGKQRKASSNHTVDTVAPVNLLIDNLSDEDLLQ